MANNNVQNVRFLRNGNLFDSRSAANAALTGYTLTAEMDGSAILARYSGTTTGETSITFIKTLVGLVYYKDSSNKSITIFDVDDAGSDVDNKIKAAIEALDAEIPSSDGTNVQVKVTEVNGKITAVNITDNTVNSTDVDTAITNAINELDGSVIAETGYFVKSVTEADGKISGTTEALPSVNAISVAGKPITAVSENLGSISATAGTINAEFVNIADSGSLITATTVEGALAEIAAEIDAMDKDADAVAGQVVTTVSETDGKVSETKANVKDLQLGGYSKSSSTGAIASTDTINEALSKLENKAAAITITNADSSINVTTGANGTDINVNIKSGEKVIKKDGNNGIYTDIDLVKITTGLPAEIKERYQLLASDDSQIGANIDIYKDSHIVSITYDKNTQELVYTYLDVSGATQTTRIDLSELVLEAEFESGVTATDHVVHGVVDSTSESFLTVGAGGFKLAGVQDAIDDAIEALDVTDDTAVAGQYVAAIEETDGIVAVKTRANVSEAVLNNYSKGSASGAVASTDTINEAIGKIEVRLDGELAALDATVSGETSDGKVNVKVTETDGKITAVDVVGTDIASASALTAEIAARKAVDGQNGDTYAANTSSPYISGATSLNDADVKLAAALKSLSDETINQVKVNGVALTEENNAVNAQIGAAAGTGAETAAIAVNTDNSTGAVTISLLGLDCGTY